MNRNSVDTSCPSLVRARVTLVAKQKVLLCQKYNPCHAACGHSHNWFTVHVMRHEYHCTEGLHQQLLMWRLNRVPRQDSVTSTLDMAEGWMACSPLQGVTHPRSKADSAFHPLSLSQQIGDTFAAKWNRWRVVCRQKQHVIVGETGNWFWGYLMTVSNVTAHTYSMTIKILGCLGREY
jgi:hypothetical protein